MADKTNDGGNAFPLHPNMNPGSADPRGMSLRDWFAGQALPEIIADHNATSEQFQDLNAAATAGLIATVSYAMADAMLAARTASGGE